MLCAAKFVHCFTANSIGLPPGFEDQRQALLRTVEQGGLDPIIALPLRTLALPFPLEADISPYNLEDGYLCRRAG